MLSFLLILIIIFILWPLLKAGWQFWRSMSRMRRFMADPEGEMRRQAEREQRRRSSSSLWGFGRRKEPADRPRGKKIPDDVGEYIEFTEVEVSEEELRDRYSQTRPDIKAEEQVSDVKWTDIK